MFNYCADKITCNQKENEKILLTFSQKFLNEFILISKISGKKYFISDIEFYISSKNHNIDKDKDNGKEITHCNERQLLTNQWYVHRTGKLSSSSLSLIQGAGIDICMGNKDKNIYTGILVREIIDCENNIKYHGPQKVVREIFQLPTLYHENKAKFINFTNQIENKSIFDTESLLFLEKNSNHFKKKIVSDKRINVNNNLLYRCRWEF